MFHLKTFVKPFVHFVVKEKSSVYSIHYIVSPLWGFGFASVFRFYNPDIPSGLCCVLETIPSRLPIYPITRLPNYTFSQLPITRLPNYPITRLPITQLPITQLPKAALRLPLG